MSTLPQDLLLQADQLLRSDLKKPKQANLRRAVSAAYYALFHFLIEEATVLVVGTSSSSRPLRQLIGRAFVHGHMKSACRDLSNPNPPALLAPFWRTYGIAASPELLNVASIFVDLQQERHRADYDLSRPFTRTEAQNIVARAQIAMSDWKRFKGAQRESAKFCALYLLHGNQLKGR